ncbi:MAG: metal ABC transporter substrate-binding protein [Clostridia bacterium]|nr:metal ABC transporter substrate-binding protein [Clostridia bacterium]
MKRFVILMITCMLALSCAAGFAFAQGEDRIGIVCTTFPQYDWVREILGDDIENVEMTLLMDSGVDLHSYQPTAADIAAIAACDLFIYVGGESDEWVEDALEASQNTDLKVISMLESVEAKEEEIVDGMQNDDDHGHSHDEDEIEYDEHVWLSLKNARTLVSIINAALCELNPGMSRVYQANADAYMDRLADLDGEYQSMVDCAARNVVLFGDRFPFRYLADDYGLEYYAAFSGCSAETEASFETIVFLSQVVDQLDLPVVMVIEGTDYSVAETVVRNTQSKDQIILVMNSMQSVTGADVQNGVDYLSIMRDNLNALTAALNQGM